MPSGIRRRRAAKSGSAAAPARRRGKPKVHAARAVSTPGLIGEHWNTGETLLQNYARLGLAARLQKPAGGIEKDLRSHSKRSELVKLPRSATRVGRVVNVDGVTKIEYDDVDEEQEVEPKPALTPLVAALEEQAANAKPVGRKQSTGEQEWLHRLIAKHGDDYSAMQFDRKLNSFQYSAGELKKRIKKLRASEA